MMYIDSELVEVVDRVWMQLALHMASTAYLQKEVPVGAVVVCHDQLLAACHNASISRCDPTAHAEILAIRQAAKRYGNYRLQDAVIYTTLEPCAMCAGAMVHARVSRLCIALADPKSGACGSVLDVVRHSSLNHWLTVDVGLGAAQSRQLLQGFFKARR